MDKGKFLKDLLSRWAIPLVKDDEVFTKVIHRGECYSIPETRADEIACPRCKQNKGFKCEPFTWSCANPECIKANAQIRKR